jgi:hypothetical protein
MRNLSPEEGDGRTVTLTCNSSSGRGYTHPAAQANSSLSVGGSVSSGSNAFVMYTAGVSLDPANNFSAPSLYAGGNTIVATASETVFWGIACWLEAFSKSGSGTIAETWSLYANKSTVGSANHGAYFAGSVGIGSATMPGGGGNPVLVLAQLASAPSSLGSNTVAFYSLNNGSTAEAYVKDEAGNQTQLSSHYSGDLVAYAPADPYPWALHRPTAFWGANG